jgi:hypothetical protein
MKKMNRTFQQKQRAAGLIAAQLWVALYLAPAVAAPATIAAPVSASPPAFEVVSRFEQSLYPRAFTAAFDSAAEWQNFWKKHSLSDAPEIDFRRYQVLMVMAGERPTPGYGLCVDQLEVTSTEVVVNVKATQPAGDTFLPQVNHYPGCVVKVPRQSKPFRFVTPGTRVVVAEKKMPMRTLSQITNSLVLEPRKVIIRDETAYRQLWRLHHSNQSDAPPVNFNEEMVVAIFLGEQTTGGYSVNIDKITESTQGLQVNYSITQPNPDEIVIQMLTAPTHWVVIKKIDAPVNFSETSP